MVVSIGEATLVLTDPKSDAPLAHWSLPAVERLNPGETPARYSPAGADDEDRLDILEINDEWMVEAIGKVQLAIEQRRSRPGRVRGGLTLAALAAMLLAAVIWLPPALRAHAVRITPPAERAEIGETILAEMAAVSGGAPCRNPVGRQGIMRLTQRLGLPDDSRIEILPQGLEGAVMLPGRIAVAAEGLIAGQSGPEPLAGHVLAARIRADAADPLADVIDYVSFPELLRLLTSGSLPREALDGYGAALLDASPPRAADQALLSGFRDKRVPTTPFATSLPNRALPPVALTESDPFRSAPYPPIMSERDWVSLQQICLPPG
ncbi:hypothetical protein [Paracoccus sediminicola]|uniref:hypothetical protein n=1 Tax=Paracoccus sediminicola TaxID=3017783 RepID=UPI0022EFFD41|nr:hypothetical protein [Paracoccus sediminicola]WBU55584.1 hypothetical protein PAF18_08565 [Paracoccus sediminicola]